MAWEMFDRDGGVGFQICGVDANALANAPIAGLPVGCEIVISATSAAPASLQATEQELERVAESLGGTIVATIRTRTELRTLVYLASDEGADRFSRVSLPPGASVSVAPAIDPDWTLFAATRPTGIEEQSMFDFRVRTQLFAAGDVGGERPIEHIVEGLTDETAGRFMASVAAAFTSVSGEVAGDDVNSWRVTHVADPKDVTESSWMIRQIAERHGATYDGWGCDVVRAEAPTRKRRLFR